MVKTSVVPLLLFFSGDTAQWQTKWRCASVTALALAQASLGLAKKRPSEGSEAFKSVDSTMFATLATCHAGALTTRLTTRPGACTRSSCSRPIATIYRRGSTLVRLPGARNGSQMPRSSVRSVLYARSPDKLSSLSACTDLDVACCRKSQRTNLASTLRGRLVVKAGGASRSEAASVNLRNPQPLRLLLVPAAALAVLGQVIDGKGETLTPET